MARTRDTDVARNSIAAQGQGEQAVQRSHESLQNSKNRALDRKQQEADRAIRQQQVDIQRQEMWNRQWQATRAARSQRDATRAQNQAAKPRTTNFGSGKTQWQMDAEAAGNIDPGRQSAQALAQQGPAATTQRGGNPGPDNPSGGKPTFGARPVRDDTLPQGQRVSQEQEPELQGPPLPPGFQGPNDPAQPGQEGFQGPMEEQPMPLAEGGMGTGMASLEEQEAQRRANQQMDERDLENTKYNKYIAGLPIEEQRQIAMTERTMAARDADARTRWNNSVSAMNQQLLKAATAKTAAAKKEHEAKAEIQRENLEGRLASLVDVLGRVASGDATQEDKDGIREQARDPKYGVPPVGSGAPILQAIAEERFEDPAVQRWLSGQIARQAVQYVLAVGKLPGKAGVNMASAGMQRLFANIYVAQERFLPGAIDSATMGANGRISRAQLDQIRRGSATHTEMVHKLGALLTLQGMDGTINPALVQPGADPMKHRQATPGVVRPAEQSGQISPEAAGAEAERVGGVAAPKTSKTPYVKDRWRTSPMGPTPYRENRYPESRGD